MIEIKKNAEPKLSRPTFLVDGKLNDKLDDFELTKYLNKSHFSLFLGKPASGKSSLIISFLKTKTLFYKTYHNIFVFMPPNSRQSIKDTFFDKNLPAEQIMDELDLESLETVYDSCRANADDGFRTLIIMDDVQKSLKDKAVQKLLLNMIMNRRHLRITIWFACQNYKSIPLQVRMGITDLFLFKISKREMQNIFEEQIEQHKDMFIEILKYAFQQPHDFLYINTLEQKIFRNWDELIIEQPNHA